MAHRVFALPSAGEERLAVGIALAWRRQHRAQIRKALRARFSGEKWRGNRSGIGWPGSDPVVFDTRDFRASEHTRENATGDHGEPLHDAAL